MGSGQVSMRNNWIRRMERMSEDEKEERKRKYREYYKTHKHLWDKYKLKKK